MVLICYRIKGHCLENVSSADHISHFHLLTLSHEMVRIIISQPNIIRGQLFHVIINYSMIVDCFCMSNKLLFCNTINLLVK
jgi:hypothetical protein